MSRILTLCICLGTFPLVSADNDIYIPEDIRAAYAEMNLTESQMAPFDQQMLVAIEQVKSMIKRENAKNILGAERRIRVKARNIFKKHTPSVVALLEANQVAAYDRYIKLMHETMTSSVRRKFVDRVNDPRPGMKVRDL